MKKQSVRSVKKKLIPPPSTPVVAVVRSIAQNVKVTLLNRTIARNVLG